MTEHVQQILVATYFNTYTSTIDMAGKHLNTSTNVTKTISNIHSINIINRIHIVYVHSDQKENRIQQYDTGSKSKVKLTKNLKEIILEVRLYIQN